MRILEHNGYRVGDDLVFVGVDGQRDRNMTVGKVYKLRNINDNPFDNDDSRFYEIVDDDKMVVEKFSYKFKLYIKPVELPNDLFTI